MLGCRRSDRCSASLFSGSRSWRHHGREKQPGGHQNGDDTHCRCQGSANFRRRKTLARGRRRGSDRRARHLGRRKPAAQLTRKSLAGSCDGTATIAQCRRHPAGKGISRQRLIVGNLVADFGPQPCFQVCQRDTTRESGPVQNQPQLLARVSAIQQVIQHEARVAQPNHLRHDRHTDQIGSIEEGKGGLIKRQPKIYQDP